MSFTKSDISKLYIATLGRASEGDANKYWQDVSNSSNMSLNEITNVLLNSSESKLYFNGLDNKGFIDKIYKVLLNKGSGVDEEGKSFWTKYLNNDSFNRADILVAILENLNSSHANEIDKSVFISKVQASDRFADISIGKGSFGKEFNDVSLKTFAKSIIKDAKPISKVVGGGRQHLQKT